MDAAEGDRLAVGPFGRRLRELVAVALIVGVGDDAVLLVVVAEDHELRSHPPADRLDAVVEHGVGEAPVGGEGTGERDGRGGDGHGAGSIDRRCGDLPKRYTADLTPGTPGLTL